MKRVLTMVALITLMLSTVAAADARCRGWGGGMGYEGFHHGREMAHDLKPTPEQLSRWKELKEEFRSEILPLRNQIFSKRMELSALLAQPDADPEAIKTKHREVIALRGQLQEKMMDHRLAFRKTLTPEQLSHWIARKSARPWCRWGVGPEGGRGPRHGMGPGRGMGPGCWNW